MTRTVATRNGEWRGEGLVLLVDDEVTVRSVGQRMLERLGFRVLAVEDGEQGVAALGEHGAEIVLVILDMTMPRLSGEETFRQMRRICPGVRVVLTTGYGEQDAMSRFTAEGLAGFLQKPFQLADLRDKMRALLAGG
jgi:two-component system cell cycle sensor histidine kinase/response regulator CckA